MTGISAYSTDHERADAFYRFSVKCDRTTNARIEAAARKAGMSATGFVQSHFETILTGAATASTNGGAEFEPRKFAEKYGISVTSARVWKWMRDKAGDGGAATATLMQMANVVAGSATSTASRYRDELIQVGLLEVTHRTNGPAGTTYRVNGEA